MNILDKIVAYKRKEVDERKELYPIKLLQKSLYFSSPIKKPLKPASFSWHTISGLLIPLSDILYLSDGIYLSRSNEVLISTSKVSRLRLFTPIISTASDTF